MENGEDFEEPFIPEWTKQEDLELVEKIGALNKSDCQMRFFRRLKMMNWDEITVGEHASEECRSQWEKIQANVRTYRILPEVLADAVEWINGPTYNLAKSKVYHPDLPKRPLPSFMKYRNEQHHKISVKHPTLPREEIEQKVRRKFDRLSDEKKLRLDEEYRAAFQAYKEKTTEFMEAHPEYRKTPQKTKRKPKRRNPLPHSTKAAFDFYCESKSQLDDTEEIRKERRETLKAKWETMGKKRKSKYIRMALDDEERFQAEMNDFVAANPEKVTLQRKHKCRVTKKDMLLLHSVSGRPKMPIPTTYTLFCQDFHHSLLENNGHQDDWMKLAAEAWRSLPTEKKEELKERVESGILQFRADCERYLESIPEEKREMERKILKIGGKENGTKPRRRKRTLSANPTLLNEGEAEPERKKSKIADLVREKVLEYFAWEHEERIKEENPDVEDDQIKQLLEQAYDELSTEEKKKYETRACRIIERENQ